MTEIFADLRYALRGLRRSPLFATVAILSLALGIGANTAIFTLIDQILLRKLPVAAPDELVMLYQQGPNMGSNAGSRMHSYPLYQDLQKRAEPLADVLCRRMIDASISVENQTERVSAEVVSGNYFSMLGVKAGDRASVQLAGGRSDLRGAPGRRAQPHYWVNRFARDPNVVGKTDPRQ